MPAIFQPNIRKGTSSEISSGAASVDQAQNHGTSRLNSLADRLSDQMLTKKSKNNALLAKKPEMSKTARLEQTVSSRKEITGQTSQGKAFDATVNESKAVERILKRKSIKPAAIGSMPIVLDSNTPERSDIAAIEAKPDKNIGPNRDRATVVNTPDQIGASNQKDDAKNGSEKAFVRLEPGRPGVFNTFKEDLKLKPANDNIEGKGSKTMLPELESDHARINIAPLTMDEDTAQVEKQGATEDTKKESRRKILPFGTF